MRHRAAVPAALLLLALSSCADAESTADAPTPTPTPSASTVPGTRPSPTVTSSAPDGPETPSATEEVLPTAAPSTGPPTPLSTESVAATPETLDGYRALATGLGAFFTAAQKMEKRYPDADPQNADEVDDLLGDVYPDGVDLVVFGVANASFTVCLTGPAATFQLLAAHDDGIRQIFGGGDCGDPASIDAEADGDVVVDITVGLAGEKPRTEYTATVVKGQNLAAQIADLDAWIRILNAEMAG